MIITAKITDWDGDRWLGIQCDSDIYKMLSERCAKEVKIEIHDGRRHSPKQHNKIFAIINDITKFINGEVKKKDFNETLRLMKLLYIQDKSDSEAVRRAITRNYCDLVNIDIFSLSNVDMTTAREFIDYLVELCVRFNVPTDDTLLNLCEDIGKYLYHCVANRKCCICGKGADIHEVEKVGMGRSRVRMHHVGQLVQPLCRSHHMEEENIGQKAFDEKYHLQAIKLDEKLCKILKWKV